jgi:hypothetical protein
MCPVPEQTPRQQTEEDLFLDIPIHPVSALYTFRFELHKEQSATYSVPLKSYVPATHGAAVNQVTWSEKGNSRITGWLYAIYNYRNNTPKVNTT